MALDPREFLRPRRPKSGPDDTATAPLAGTRKQRIQRLQFGLFGLGTMVLLVGLADIIQTSAQQTQATAVPDAAPTVSTEDVPPPRSRDPLADAGVVPDLPDESDAENEAPTNPQGDDDGRAVQVE